MANPLDMLKYLQGQGNTAMPTATPMVGQAATPPAYNIGGFFQQPEISSLGLGLLAASGQQPAGTNRMALLAPYIARGMQSGQAQREKARELALLEPYRKGQLELQNLQIGQAQDAAKMRELQATLPERLAQFGGTAPGVVGGPMTTAMGAMGIKDREKELASIFAESGYPEKAAEMYTDAIKPYEYKSPEGKKFADIQHAIETYGYNSPEVKRLMKAMTPEGKPLSDTIEERFFNKHKTMGQIQGAINAYRGFLEESGMEPPWGGQERQKLETGHTVLLMHLKELFNLGVLNGPDLEIMTDMMGDPTGWTAFNPRGAKNLLAKLGVVEDLFHKEIRSTDEGYKTMGGTKFNFNTLIPGQGAAKGASSMTYQGKTINAPPGFVIRQGP